MSVDTRTTYHDIVDNRKAALTADPFSLAILESAVRQHGCLVETYSSAILGLGNRKLIWVEKLPDGSIDNLIRRVAENVDNRVGRVKNAGVVGQICTNERLLFVSNGPDVPWMVMKVVSMVASWAGVDDSKRDVVSTAAARLCRI
jgi:hypothetical protein